jgi:two-component sensor histidine kinase
MLDYFKNLGESLLDSFGLSDQIDIQYDMAPLELNIDTAVPIGLIVNELVTNVLKHAFPENKKGRIRISLQASTARNLYLEVEDNGIGKNSYSPKRMEGFGMQLVELLTQQLEGRKEEVVQNGTRFSFNLKSVSALPSEGEN